MSCWGCNETMISNTLVHPSISPLPIPPDRSIIYRSLVFVDGPLPAFAFRREDGRSHGHEYGQQRDGSRSPMSSQKVSTNASKFSDKTAFRSLTHWKPRASWKAAPFRTLWRTSKNFVPCGIGLGSPSKPVLRVHRNRTIEACPCVAGFVDYLAVGQKCLLE